MATAAAVICSLVTATILLTEFSRLVFDRTMHRLVAVEAARHVNELYFLVWDDICRWYEQIGSAVFGFGGLSPDPLEAKKILALVEKRMNLGDETENAKRRAIIENARASFPTTFDCYRFYAHGRAIISAISAYLLAFRLLENSGTGGTTATVVVIILGIVLLTTLPQAVVAISVLKRAVRRRPSSFK